MPRAQQEPRHDDWGPSLISHLSLLISLERIQTGQPIQNATHSYLSIPAFKLHAATRSIW